MSAHLHAPSSDPGVWYRLTDEYAAALCAMAHGEPKARERVQALYAQMRRELIPVAPGCAVHPSA